MYVICRHHHTWIKFAQVLLQAFILPSWTILHFDAIHSLVYLVHLQQQTGCTSFLIRQSTMYQLKHLRSEDVAVIWGDDNRVHPMLSGKVFPQPFRISDKIRLLRYPKTVRIALLFIFYQPNTETCTQQEAHRCYKVGSPGNKASIPAEQSNLWQKWQAIEEV